MKYAIIAISGSQFKIEENQTITIDKIEGNKGDKLSTDQVLLIADGDKVTVGTPTIKGSSVDYEIVNNYQGDKLLITKYKSKSRYRRRMGFRAQLTDIIITKINS